MSLLQLSAPNPLHSEAQRTDTNNIVRLSPSVQDRPVLPVGKVLEVLVADNGRMQLGVMIQGQFYPAMLPKGFQPGDRLNVRVQSNEDALVLRILMGSQDSGQITNSKLPTTATLKQLFSLLLPQERQSDLEQAARVLHGARDPSILALPSGVPPPAGQAGKLSKGAPALTGPLATVIGNLVARLQGEHAILEEGTFGDQQQVTRVLTAFAEKNLKGSVAEARRAVETLAAKATQPGSTERLARVLTQHLEHLFSGTENLGFDAQSPTPEGADVQARVLSNLQLTTALSRYAMLGGNAALLENVRVTLSSGAAKHNPLSMLLQVFTGGSFSPLGAENPMGGTDQVSAALRLVLTQLSALREQGADNVMVRTHLQNALQVLKTALPSRLSGDFEPQASATASRAAKTLETLLSGQEALNQVNPLLRTLGEPSMLMIPIVLGTHITPLELLLYPGRVDPDAHDALRREKKEPFTRIDIRINLPHLGSLSVAVAHRTNEMLVAITSSSEQVCSVIQKHLPVLEKRIRERGVEQVALRAEVGETESQILPRVMARRNSVAVV